MSCGKLKRVKVSTDLNYGQDVINTQEEYVYSKVPLFVEKYFLNIIK